VGLYDLNSRKGNAEAARFFGDQAFGNREELLAAETDAFNIVTPVYLHCEQVAQCFRTGRHVLREKPLALSVAAGQEVVAFAKACERQLGVGLMMRFHSQHQEALKTIRSGKLGRPVWGRAQLSCWYPAWEGAWRQDPSQTRGGSGFATPYNGVDQPNYDAQPLAFFNPRSSPNHQCFSTAQFSPPEWGVIGTASRRFFHGAGLNNWDRGLHKKSHVTERTALEFQAEFVNILDDAQFNNPVGNFAFLTLARSLALGPRGLDNWP
jgi:hypothetical protein